MGHLAAVGFVENQDVEVCHPTAECPQFVFLEMVEEQIGDQHSASVRCGSFKDVSLVPNDAQVQISGPWCEVEGSHRRIWKEPCKTVAESAIACADFDDTTVCLVRMPVHRAADPAFVTHQEIDPSQILPAPQCIGIVRWQVIE